MALIPDKTPPPRSPAPNHDPVFSWPTPNQEDRLFWVEKNADLPKNKDFTYGDPYTGANAQLYPDHKLVFVTPQTPEKWSKWIYASARITQDAYNWEFTDADIGSTKFKAVKRTYVNLRSGFSVGEITMGTQMPNVPAGLFTGEYILAIRQEVRIPEQELDALFIAEERTFVQRCTISDITTDPTLGAGVSKTTTLHYRGEVVSGTAIETLFAAPTNTYWGQQSDGTEREGRQISDNWFAVITTSTLDATRTAWKKVTPGKTDLRIPGELLGVSVVWNKAGGVGVFDSNFTGVQASEGTGVRAGLSGSEQASANGSASIQPDLVLNIKEREGRDIPCLDCFFMLPLVSNEITDAAFLVKVATVSGQTIAGHWPTFNPVAHSIVLKGQKVSVAAKASGSASFSAQNTSDPITFTSERNEGSGTDKDYSTMMGTTRIPPTIHAEITIADATDSQNTSATCDVGWVGTGTATLTVDGTTYDLKIPDVTAAADTGTVTANGAVSPTTLAATTPETVPTSGWYVTNVKFSPLDSRWMQCYAQVFDASNL